MLRNLEISRICLLCELVAILIGNISRLESYYDIYDFIFDAGNPAVLQSPILYFLP